VFIIFTSTNLILTNISDFEIFGYITSFSTENLTSLLNSEWMSSRTVLSRTLKNTFIVTSVDMFVIFTDTPSTISSDIFDHTFTTFWCTGLFRTKFENNSSFTDFTSSRIDFTFVTTVIDMTILTFTLSSTICFFDLSHEVFLSTDIGTPSLTIKFIEEWFLVIRTSLNNTFSFFTEVSTSEAFISSFTDTKIFIFDHHTTSSITFLTPRN
jgi:hypothetical protein